MDRLKTFDNMESMEVLGASVRLSQVMVACSKWLRLIFLLEVWTSVEMEYWEKPD